MPDARYLVGTAVDQVDYDAPVAGTAYIVDRDQSRVIAIKSLAAGENWNYQFPKVPEREIASTFGPDQRTFELRVSLYFIPASDMGYDRIPSARSRASVETSRRRR
ncbi:hypothetical protein [Mucisphaera sp.]|uniref:hypothetical protein n=1 Tax=Mucisphaera sp. TaxID=2913024 RepID=UPI003D0D4655